MLPFLRRLLPEMGLRTAPNSAEIKVLVAIWEGQHLKSHRDIDGNKQFALHANDATKTIVPDTIVKRLRKRRYLETNQKFPAATFLLTDRGTALAQQHSTQPTGPMRARKMHSAPSEA